MMIDPNQLLGIHEVAELAKVKPSTAHNWTRRYDDFPKPVQVLRMGPVFVRFQVEFWLVAHDRF